MRSTNVYRRIVLAAYWPGEIRFIVVEGGLKSNPHLRLSDYRFWRFGAYLGLFCSKRGKSDTRLGVSDYRF